MAKNTIFSVNTIIPGKDIIKVDYDSDQTLLDADIILFTPTILSEWHSDKRFQGKTCLSNDGFFRVQKQTRHWQNEIESATNAGKLVIVYLETPVDFVHIEEDRFSINEKVITQISSYDVLGYMVAFYESKTGSKIKITKSGKIISQYMREFSNNISYCCSIEGDFSDVLLESEQGNRVVGAMIESQAGGATLLLPPVNFDDPKFMKHVAGYDEDGERYETFYWTDAGLQAGKRFMATLNSLAEAILTNTTRTPPPDWVSANRYPLLKENRLKSEIDQISKKLTGLKKEKDNLQQDLARTGWPRQLLYEQGTPLEDAILQSLKLMGFKADAFNDGESEFDSVFSGPEGRFIGEAEGRDNKPINIDKFSQLQRNLHEDFNREEINDFAKGVLFGNAYRLRTPEDRDGFFTEKCLKAAERGKIALVRTPDMFKPTRYLTENPADQNYAAACRKAIADTAGGIVEFPEPPKR